MCILHACKKLLKDLSVGSIYLMPWVSFDDVNSESYQINQIKINLQYFEQQKQKYY